jgi:hypothetical protein
MKTKTFTKKLQEALESCEVDYFSDTSWQYSNKEHKQTICIEFSQNESGENSIDKFCYQRKGIRFDVTPTDEQIKLMWEKLNNTPYRKTPEEINEIEVDPYEEYGVKRSYFY